MAEMIPIMLMEFIHVTILGLANQSLMQAVYLQFG